jgi:glycosyltransferase involved in cell wall biosynthesis
VKLLIAIPALDEERSIQSTIQRCLDASETIIACSPVSEVEITVVSDGSTDRTVELAQAYADRVDLIVFDDNRGYGAAIKEAWSHSDAELLAFLDADGTCDPIFFSELCTTLERDRADVALGSRINADSAMPRLRRVGNVLFALLLSAFSSQRVRDTASGMRVVRRSSLPALLPLPDGLHFTPAMSARVMLGEGLRLSEVDMPYHEREGQSKLRAGRDGIRFLQVILQTASLYRPSRLLGLFGLLSLAVAVVLMVVPALHYLSNGALEEWMIYRFIVSDLAGVSACLLLCTAYLTRRIVTVTLFVDTRSDTPVGRLRSVFRSRWFWIAPLMLLVLGTALVIYSFLERVTTGATYEHWSRFIAMSFLYAVALILSVTRIIDYFLDLVSERLTYQRSLPAAEPVSEPEVPILAP